MKYYILPFGCQMNRSDVERIKTVIETMGYQESDHEDDAQLIGIVACSVRQKAIDKVYAKIRRWNQRKDRQNLITFVTGCILDADKEKFLKQFDILFSPAELDEFPTMLKQYGVVTGQSAGLSDPRRIDSFWQVNPTYTSRFEAFVPIQNGCDKFCTFCAVPYTRGREVSRSSTEILADRTQVLGGISHFQAKQDDHPGEIDPDHQDRQSGHGAVNRIIARHSNLKVQISPLADLPECATKNAANQSRTRADFDIRHKEVETGKNQPHHHEGQNIEERK